MNVEHIKNNAPHKKSRGAHAPRLIYFFSKDAEADTPKKELRKKRDYILRVHKSKILHL